MVKPPLRTKSIGFKVSQEEYARLETAAQADGRTLGEWCREAILRGVDESDYYPYGGEMQLCNSSPQNYKFTGKERDTETGLDDFDARHYSSAMGRFM